MAKAKTQEVRQPTLFDVFDYYDEKGELQNDVLNPNNRYRDQRTDRELFQGQEQTSGAFSDRYDEIPSDRGTAGSIYKESERGGIRRIWEYDHTRGDMGARDKQARKKIAKNSSRTTDRVLFRQEDLDDNRGRMARDKPISQSASKGDNEPSNREPLSSSLDNGDPSAMGKTSLSQSNKSSGLRQTDLFSEEAARSGDGGIYASITSTQYSESNALSGIGNNGSEPQSVLPSVDGATKQYEFQSQQYMGDSSRGTQGESNRGELLDNKLNTKSNKTTITKIIKQGERYKKVKIEKDGKGGVWTTEVIDAGYFDPSYQQELKELYEAQKNTESAVPQTASNPTNTTTKESDSNLRDTQATQIPNFTATRKSGEAPSLLADEEDLVVGENYKLNEDITIKGLRTRFEANIAAISTLKELQASKAIPTEEQKEVLSKFSGFGGMATIINGRFNGDYAKEYAMLCQIVHDDQELARLERSCTDAYYTPKFIIDSIYKSLEHFGLNNDPNTKHIYEPSCGNGRFIGYMPESNYKMHGTELDTITYDIAKLLYPQANLENKAFERVIFNRNFDAFIGNPPYGDKDTGNENGEGKVCDFFMLNAIKNLKDDGIAAFVVSSGFLDKQNETIRAKIAKEATFIGAIRLPNNVFKDTNAEVTSDIVFFKKGLDENINQAWVKSKNAGGNANVNEYFFNHRHHILGDLAFVSTKWGEKLAVKDSGKDLKQEIADIIATLPKDIYQYHEPIFKYKSSYLNPNAPQYENIARYISGLKERSLCIIDGNVYQVVDTKGRLRSTEQNYTDKEIEKIRGFIAIRDTFNELVALEQSNIADDDTRLVNKRAELNQAYDSFVKNYGYLSNPRNIALYRSIDPECNKITALEKQYDKGIGREAAKKNGVEPRKPSAIKADIFHTRTIRPAKEYVIKTPKDALMASLSIYGAINNEWIESALPQMEKEAIFNDLLEQKLIFVNHLDKSQYLSVDLYLSGNVKAKYKEVENLVNNGDESLRVNLEALKESLPKDIKAADIAVTLGTSWIPANYYEEFIAEQFGLDLSDVGVEHSKHLGWGANFKDSNVSTEAMHKYGYKSDRHSVYPSTILEYAFANNALILTKPSTTRFDKNGEPERETDHEATAIVNEKIENLKLAFKEWIFKDIDRREHLEHIYNKTFNTHIARKYDGSHLSLPGFSSAKELYPHQKDAIWAAIQNKSILLDHQVGAGKTLSTICTLMEQKRMGLINKPLVIVPNHITEQWNKDFYDAYPNANILVATKEDLSPNRREEFYAKIASNNWDCVIMAHSQLEKIPMPNEFYEDYILEAKEELEAFKNELKEKRDINRIDKMLTKLENQLHKNRESKTKSIDFSELGVDSIVIDEAHEFKNLGVNTKMKNVLGLGTREPSQKAQNLYVLTKYLHANDKRVMFLTGTPISNSVTELYTMQRYLQPQLLKEKGIESFDSWASCFGESVNDFELDSSGINYKLVTRFSKFNNISELSDMYRANTHIVTNADILRLNPSFVPPLANGKPINIIAPRSEDVAHFIGYQLEDGTWNVGSIVWRMENFKDDPRHNNVLACTTDARKAGLDYRLIDSNANDYAESKSSLLANEVFKRWEQWQEDRGTQLIFCDLSTPKIHSQKIACDREMSEAEIEAIAKAEAKETENLNAIMKSDEISESIESKEKSNDEIIASQARFDVYSDVLKKLVAKGIPQREIAFIHDAKTPPQKQALFDKVNRGEVRVLIGSRSKMGAGTNVQQRGVAIHHLDCPWRPSDLEQSNGRFIRQGNLLHAKYGEHFAIEELRYATEKTYDARMWQTIESKARSIEQFRNADKSVREIDEVSMGSASAGEMKAEAVGNPLMLLQIRLANELRKENAKETAFKKELFDNEEALRKNIEIKPLWEKELNDLRTFKEILSVNPKGEYFKCECFDIASREFKLYEIKTEPKNTGNTQENKETPKKENPQQVALEKAFWENFDTLFNSDGNEAIFFKYRGFSIGGSFSSDMKSFGFYFADSANNYIEPDNLVYTINPNNILQNDFRSVIKFSGLWARINNFASNIDKHIETQEEKLRKNAELVAFLSEQIKHNEYPNATYLDTLRKDNSQVIKEIQKMSSIKGYVSNFVPKSFEIKVAKEKVQMDK